jgi:hypothetical protein
MNKTVQKEVKEFENEVSWYSSSQKLSESFMREVDLRINWDDMYSDVLMGFATKYARQLEYSEDKITEI